MEIRKLLRKEIDDALPLVWDAFNEYEAVNYPESGKEAFWNAIHSKAYLDMLTAYGAFDCGKLVGIIATRSRGSHIALFFVDGYYHRKGIGRRLFETCLAENENARITVHSSVYAADVYRRLGFIQTDDCREDKGMIYIPMVYEKKVHAELRT